jgi:hypothetical protein
MKKSTGGLQKPFFASFLENQIRSENAHNVQGGGDPSTNIIADQPQTMKYPSDCEDNPTDKEKDDDFSKKYPSDCEDDVKQ